MNNTIVRSPILAALISIALIAGIAGAGEARAAGVVPRDELVRGNTYGEWGARWWQWILSIPTANNPNFDATGANCAEGQSGPVWFVGGSFGTDPVERSCTIPKGKFIFVPIVNFVVGSAVFDCDPTAEGVLCNLATLRKSSFDFLEDTSLSFRLDGVAIPALKSYRASTPEFTVTLPEGNIVSTLGGTEIAAGTYTPQLSDGYWLMLRPLPPGEHTLRYQAVKNSGPNAGPGALIIYHLTIAP